MLLLAGVLVETPVFGDNLQLLIVKSFRGVQFPSALFETRFHGVTWKIPCLIHFPLQLTFYENSLKSCRSAQMESTATGCVTPC